ncbi:MAG: hypothetical protein GY745_01905 [Actinomycetia bacterium]|nr:hypothetical protein [Actinomycetes bacterium]MCP3912561.1 hypothetical protein [Actinomycetes bacterium]MCP4083803.1 hypothetical protein [Actinomycetes bacterium]
MLNRLDDYPIHQTPEPIAHPASSDPNVYDRTWFNGYSDDGTRYFGLGLAVYPHRGILDCHFSTVEAGGRQHCFYGSRRAPQERTEMAVGPFRLEIIEPLRQARVIVDENESGVACDLIFSARTSAIQEARQILWDRQRKTMDATRFAQFGRWTGTVSHPDGEYTVDSETWRGTKDRSWGIRRVGERVPVGAPHPQSPFFFLWAPLQWDDHISHTVFFDGPRGDALVREALTSPLFASEADIPDELDDVVTPMATAVHRLEYHPGTRLVARGELDLIDLYGAVRTITMEPRLRFQFKGLGYGHPTWGQGFWKGELEIAGESFDPAELDLLAPENIHVQQVVEVSDGERQGIGALEQVVIGPYEPAGFTDWFDGAR